MHQRFIQSRRQYIVERLCQSILLVVVLLLMNALLGGGTYQINSAVMYLPIFMMVVITLWLVVFNSGQAKVIEHQLTVSDTGVCYIKFGQEQYILWQDFAGFELQGWPKTVIISSRKPNQQPIIFSYYTFSSAQRNAIFDLLRKKQAYLLALSVKRPPNAAY
jgi:hypothetical protein